MIPKRIATVALGAILLASTAAAAVAQDATTPEGTTWHLTSHTSNGEVILVPFGVDATLLLQAGVASGSGGCNSFTGSYQLSGSALAFGDEVATTLKLCSQDVQAVEDAYLAALPTVASWAIVEGVLELRDGLGEAILTFEVPSVGLTKSDVEALAATLEGLRSEIEALRQDVRRLNVDRLRERIVVLEDDAGDLRERLDALGEEPAPGEPDSTGQGNGFTRAEGVLLEGIPGRIASTCLPRRSELPAGTLAAVECQPNSSTVAELVYHLLEGEDAAAEFEAVMSAQEVPEATSEEATCLQGRKSQRHWVGQGYQAEGCYREAAVARMRVVDLATECRRLTIAGQRLDVPSIYISVVGSDGSLSDLAGWVNRIDTPPQVTSITQPIQRPNAALSPGCTT